MKKRVLCMLMAGILLLPSASACEKKNESAEKQENTEELSETKDEKEGTDAAEASVTDTDDKDSKGSEQNNSENSSGITISLPENTESDIDYTSAEGLVLPAGTRIAVIAKSTKTPYFKAVKEGMKLAIEDLNKAAGLSGKNAITMTFEAPSNSNDAEGQINIGDAVLSENPDALCLSAIDVASFGAQLEAAAENGIPVTIFDSSIAAVDGADYDYTICQTDNYAAGAKAASKMAALMKGSGSVLIVADEKNTESIENRISGFKKRLKKKHSGITVKEVMYGDDDEDTRDLAERIKEELDENPDITGIFATNEIAAEDVLDVLENYEGNRPAFIGFDTGSKQIQAVRDGLEDGFIGQNPYGMGYATIISVARSILGKDNDAVIDPGYHWIDISNFDKEKNQMYLYE